MDIGDCCVVADVEASGGGCEEDRRRKVVFDQCALRARSSGVRKRTTVLGNGPRLEKVI